MNRAGKAMPNNPNSFAGRILPLALASALVACSESTPEPTGICQPDPVVNCAVGSFSAEAVHLAGYSCTGTARPDDSPTYIDGIPQGMVCSDQIAVGTDGRAGYCCTAYDTQCAYNPTAICAQEGTYGFQCWGPNRPEVVNASIYCDQGVRTDDLINYCCNGTGIKTNCTQSDAIGCMAGMTGWTCPAGTQPTAQDLGANKSRADLYYLLCPVPTPAPNPKYETLCCYVPTLVPVGGTCQQNMKADCAQGRFGISCLGTDKPEDNFWRLSCPDPGVPGISEFGYPATNYCCDFKR
jgi:hypothetical protein